jgi:RNA polymerase subunit RPABC4/transcription elongation factor Spt4
VKFCFQCGRITPGDPLFCNYCGRSYDTKLCPRMHPNPRRAEVCSRCGSRDFSTPQPLRPIWAPVLQFLLSAIPGFFLVLASVALVLFFLIAVLSNPNALLSRNSLVGLVTDPPVVPPSDLLVPETDTWRRRTRR